MKYLEKLVSIRSDKNCDKILEYIKAELDKTAVEVRIFGVENKILLAGINTKLKNIEPIMLAGHIDTVCANESLYNTNPYVLTEIDGVAYGLGAIDMKSFTAVVMDNIEKLKNFDCPIVFALTTDEETTLNSTEFMVKTLKELDIKPKFTILGEPTNSAFSFYSNACYEYKAKFFGKACHSSRIQDGVNAICACARFVAFLEEAQKKYRLTSNCGVIKGGEVVNKVADYTELIYDIRSIYPDDIDDFLSDISCFVKSLESEYSGLKIEIENQLKIPAFNMEGNEKIKAIGKELGIGCYQFSGGCEAGYYTEYSGDAVVFGVGDLALAHKPNEYVKVSEYYDYSNMLLGVLKCVKRLYF